LVGDNSVLFTGSPDVHVLDGNFRGNNSLLCLSAEVGNFLGYSSSFSLPEDVRPDIIGGDILSLPLATAVFLLGNLNGDVSVLLTEVLPASLGEDFSTFQSLKGLLTGNLAGDDFTGDVPFLFSESNNFFGDSVFSSSLLGDLTGNIDFLSLLA
jgi:hypothetical protein